MALVVVALLAAGCGGGGGGDRPRSACDGRIDGRETVTIWARAGTDDERTVLDSQVATFNQRSGSNVRAELVHVPPGELQARLEAAAAAGELPDVVQLDAALLPRLASRGELLPLFGCLDDDLKANLLPRVTQQGTWDGTLYGVGAHDAGAALYARRSVLARHGLRVPNGFEDAWTSEEMTQALTRLASAGFERPLELRVADANVDAAALVYASVVHSAGGDLLDRRSGTTAQGALNRPAVVEAMTQLQRWFTDNLVQRARASDAFIAGDAAIAWAGQDRWAAYRQAFGDDLVVMPPPDWGNGTRSGMGTWPWVITTAAGGGDAAWQFIDFQLADDQVLETTAANGALPATRSALARSPSFAEGAPMSFFLRELQDPEVAVPRPQTPAWPTVAAAFRRAIADITNGGDVQAALDAAVTAIDADLRASDGDQPRS